MRDLKVRVSIGLLILGDFNKIKECLNINVQFPLGNLSYMSCCCQVYLTLSAGHCSLSYSFDFLLESKQIILWES